MPKLKVKRKTRADGEGTIFSREIKRRDGSTYIRWEAKTPRLADGRRQTLYGKTQGEVKNKLEQLKAQLATGTYSVTKLTVQDFLERWHNEKAKAVKPRTVELYRFQADRHINPVIGRVKLSKLTPMHLQNLCSNIAENTGRRTAEMIRAQLLGAFKQAVRWELIPRNPAEAVTPVKVPRTEVTIWTPTEATRFLDTARTNRLYVAFYLAMSTGLRRGELLGLEWGHIKGDRLKVMTSKTRKGHRTLKLSQDVVGVLEQHRSQQKVEKQTLANWQAGDLVFTSTTGAPINPRNFERTWKRLQQATRDKWIKDIQQLLEANLSPNQQAQLEADLKALKEGRIFPTLRLHDLRHLHASMLICKANLSAVEVADRLGHTNPSFTMDVYGHLFAEHQPEEEVSILEFLPQLGQTN